MALANQTGGGQEYYLNLPLWQLEEQIIRFNRLAEEMKQQAGRR